VSTAPPAKGRAQRYTLSLPSQDKTKPWAVAGKAALKTVLREDDLCRLATSLFQSPLTTETYTHYSSNLTGFFKFCSEHALEPLATTSVDIAR